MDKTKKLLIVGGGKSIHTFSLIDLIGDYFDDCLLITNYKNNNYPNQKQREIDYSLKNPIHLITSTLYINKIIKKYKPCFIILLQVDTGAFLTTLANTKKIPTLVIAMGSDILLTPQKNFIYHFMARYILNHNKYYNTGAKYVGERMQELVGKNISVVIANLGFNSKIEPKGKKNIIYSNRLHKPLYRIDKIIKSFALFVKNNPSWQLVIAANGDEKNLNNLIKTLNIEDKVKLVGWLNSEENNNYYAISKIWVSIPMSDCTPISLMEAMKAQCLPIVSNLPTMHEWIQDKENGIIVNDLDTDFFSCALDMNYDKVIKINNEIVDNFGSKEKNREKFYSIFNNEFKKE